MVYTVEKKVVQTENYNENYGEYSSYSKKKLCFYVAGN